MGNWTFEKKFGVAVTGLYCSSVTGLAAGNAIGVWDVPWECCVGLPFAAIALVLMLGALFAALGG